MLKIFPFIQRLYTTLIPGILLVGLFACNQTDLTPGPVIEAPLVSLNYDDDNLTAPLLPGNTYEAGVRFTSAETQEIQGGKLIEVYYYLLEKPASCAIRIYRKSTADGPEILAYSAATTNEINAQSWNKHTLATPIDIGQEDLWIAVRLQHSGQQQTIGCDPGPSHINGDWLFDSEDGQWTKLVDRSNNEVNINWNIRGVVDP